MELVGVLSLKEAWMPNMPECNNNNNFYRIWLLSYGNFLSCSVHLSWISFTIFMYRQTCSNNHLHNMNTHLRWPVLSLPKPIPTESLLFKMTTCLMHPTTTFLSPKLKKNCLKQPLQNFILQRNGKQDIKNKCLPNYIYSIAIL